MQVTKGSITREIEALKTLSEQTGVPGMDLNQICIRLSDLGLVPREVAEHRLLIPVLVREDSLFVAMARPDDQQSVGELEFATGKKVFSYVALESTLRRVIKDAYALKDKGGRYFIGPTCPPEVRRKVGAPEPEPLLDSMMPEPGDETDAVRADGPAGVVLDDGMRDSILPGRREPLDEGVLFDEESVEGDEDEEAPPTPPRAALAQKTVLVVDDEADVRQLLGDVLRAHGYRVIEAEQGDEALQKVREQPPDAIILDAMLPGVHGFEIARRLKQSERYGAIPVIMVSAVFRGWRFAADVKENYGVDAYLEKPFDVGELAEVVAAALRGSVAEWRSGRKATDEAERCLAAGIAAYKRGELDEALEHLHAGVRADPLAFDLHFQLGLLYGRKADTFSAIQELETAVGIRATHHAALKNLAVLYQNAGFRNKAIEMWERCLSAAPDEGAKQTAKKHLLSLL
ncbi:MAG: response regulator [Deltaproteobacteria bacterium]|nr:response regulator [Deltaproteobacteria bacterium]